MLAAELFRDILIYVTLFCIALFYWRKRRSYYLGWKLSGPIAIPILGNILSLTAASSDAIHEKNMKLYRRFLAGKEGMVRFWLGPLLIVFIDDPILTEEVLKNKLQKPPLFYNFLGSIYGKGILVHGNVGQWRKNRKAIAPIFHFSTLKSNIDVFFEEASLLVQKLKPYSINDHPFQPLELISLATFSMAIRTIVGVDMKTQENLNEPCIQAIENIFDIIQERILKPWLQMDFLYDIFGYKKETEKNRKVVRDFLKKILDKIESDEKEVLSHDMEEVQTRNIDDIEIPDHSNNFGKMIKKSLSPDNDTSNDNATMTQEQMIDEIIGLIIGGLDTTKTANHLTLNLLAIHQDIQDEVYKEIVEIFGDDKTTPPTYDQLQALECLDRVVKEVVRLYPSVPLIARSMTEESKIGDHLIPKDTTVAIFIYGIHRNPKYWEEPNKFNPDRFLPTEIDKRPQHAYLPFSIAPRNCIGYKYATLQMKTTLSTILRNYKIKLGDKCKSMDDINIGMNVTLRLFEGNDIRIEQR